MQSETRLSDLFIRYMEGCSSPEESYEFLLLINNPATESEFNRLMDQYMRDLNTAGGLSIPEQEEMLEMIFVKVKAQDHQTTLAGLRSGRMRRHPYAFWRKMCAAAAVLLILSVPAYLFVHKSKTGEENYIAYHGKISPGSNKAVLTLSDGKRVILNDAVRGEVAREQGVRIAKTGPGRVSYENMGSTGSKSKVQYNTISTPAGGQFQMRLPDGTKVWLNALSSLKYATTFHPDRPRMVYLKGEAYFEVAKHHFEAGSLPFIVHSRLQELHVLGTHFNINSYEDEAVTRSTLLEGSITISNLKGSTKTLRPGQQAQVSSEINIKQVDTSAAVAWKNGLFRFEQENFREVMNQLSRWYNIDIEYRGNVPQNKFSGELYRNMNAEKMLKILHLSGIYYQVTAPRDGSGAGRKKIIIYQKLPGK
jgi:transmembrane sensor